MPVGALLSSCLLQELAATSLLVAYLHLCCSCMTCFSQNRCSQFPWPPNLLFLRRSLHLGFQAQARRRRLSCCKWRWQAGGSNCIPCKKIVFWSYR